MRPEWTRKIWSGRLDSNQRPPAPKAGALPGCATPRHRISLILLPFPTASKLLLFPFETKPVAELSQTSSPLSRLSQNAGLVSGPVHLLQRFAFHLQFHLRVLLEHLRVPLPKELRHPLVGDTTCTETSRVRRTQIVDPEVRHLGSPQCRRPGSLECDSVAQ